MSSSESYGNKEKYIILPSELKGITGIIQATRDIPFSGVRKGDLGGEVSGYHNLSQTGDCWIGEKSKVIGSSRVEGDTLLSGSRIGENSSLIISGSSELIQTTIERCSGNITDSVIQDQLYLDNYKLNIKDSQLKNFVLGEVNNRSMHDATIVNAKIQYTKFVKNVKIFDKSSNPYGAIFIDEADFAEDAEILDSKDSKIESTYFGGKVFISDHVDISQSKFSDTVRAHDGATVISCRFECPVRIFGGGIARLRIVKHPKGIWITKDSEG